MQKYMVVFPDKKLWSKSSAIPKVQITENRVQKLLFWGIFIWEKNKEKISKQSIKETLCFIIEYSLHRSYNEVLAYYRLNK